MVHRVQRGISLIEFMLAMSIGLLLLQQLTQLLGSMAKSYDLLQQEIEIDEGKQTALMLLEYFLAQSGYLQFRPAAEQEQVFKAEQGFAEQAFIAGVDNRADIAGAKLGTDMLMLRYQVPQHATLRDCKNTLLQQNTVYAMDFYIDANADFRCRGATADNNSRSSAVLAHGIEDLQLEYGFVSATDKAVKFCDANCIDSHQAWAKLVAVRIYLSSYSSTYNAAIKTVHTIALQNISPG